MHCPICKVEFKNFNEDISKHVLMIKGVNGSNHIHGPLENKELMKEFVNEMLTHAQISDSYQAVQHAVKDLKSVVFHNRQRLGDILMFTCGIRDFKKAFPDVQVNVVSTAGHIWDHNPNIDRSLIPTEVNTIKIGPGKLTNASNRLDWHFANAFRISIEDALNVHIPQGEPRPDIYLTEEEYNAPRVFKQPYWIIVVSGEKGWGCKMYPVERWQEFINKNKDTVFIQLGAKEDDPPRLQGDNVIDWVGKTQDKENGIRDLFKLFLNAEGSIGLVSFHMHLSGALYKPAIVIAGAREPVSFTRYQGHQYITTEGCLPCAATSACWHCNIDSCSNLVIDETKTHISDRKVPKCVDIIHPDDISRALNAYYIGGRLQKRTASNKPALKNIVKSKTAPQIVKDRDLQDKDIELKKFRGQFGLQFDSGSIHYQDWQFIERIIDEHKIKTVLEFGTGLSTLLMANKGIQVISFDTNEKWVAKIKAINPALDVRIWDGVNFDIRKFLLTQKVDMAFVDGPSGGKMREHSVRTASILAPMVVIHDAYGADEKIWQEKHIIDKFQGPVKGGHWNGTYLWQKNVNAGITEMEPSMYPPISTEQKNVKAGIIEKAASKVSLNMNSKFIKIVSTARGWGGCARSITTIMKHLLLAGHKIEFIPFRNSVGSREFRECLNSTLKDVKVTLDYETLHEACDVLFVYADDYVWEFPKPEIAEKFSCLNAQCKVMMLNYRRGGIGEIEWTKRWDKYMFLNSNQELELLEVLPGVKTKVLPPCTELDVFLGVNPVFNHGLNIVRHSSQGDTKFPKAIGTDIKQILDIRLDATINMLPGPSFVNLNSRFLKTPRTDDVRVIADFLEQGNLFWYSLPQGYMDMGPRVILEAMASGLPILADNWGGAIDRVTLECGWRCNTKQEHIEIIKNVTMAELQKKGQASRERAIHEFIPANWIKEIVNV